MTKTNKKRSSSAKPLMPTIQALVEKIDVPFVRAAVEKYIDAAASVLAQSSTATASDSDLIGAVKFYAKAARTVDFIVAISSLYGATYANQNAGIETIRKNVEKELAPLFKKNEQGTICFTRGGASIVSVETASKAGRWLSRLTGPAAASVGASGAESLSAVDFSNGLRQAQRSLKKGDHNEARRQIDALLKSESAQVKDLSELGTLCLETGRADAAVAVFRKVLDLDANKIDHRVNLGNALWQHGDQDEAVRCYEDVLRVKPDCVEVLTNLGSASLQQGFEDRAGTYYSQALQANPRFVGALTGLGAVKLAHYAYDEAADLFVRALRQNPNYVEAMGNLGLLRFHQGHVAEAMKLYDKALAIKPDFLTVLRSKAFALLATDQYAAGWALYEKERDRDPERCDINPFPAKPQWTGEADPRKRLLLWWEQGFGDIIQFIRYATLCKSRVGKIYVLCPKPLVSLLNNCPYIDGAYSSILAFRFDVQAAVMSLPQILAVAEPPVAIPYLFVSPKKKQLMQQRMAAPKAALKVGLVWAGNPGKKDVSLNPIDKRRSLNLDSLRPLFAVKGVQFYNLQMGDPAAQIDSCGLRDQLIDLMPRVKDYEDTGSIIENLDLVISVDTSVVHLTGALGKPVWVLSRYDACWRWMRNRSDSPWYPTARVFGQTAPGDWQSVIGRVAQALEQAVSDAIETSHHDHSQKASA